MRKRLRVMRSATAAAIAAGWFCASASAAAPPARLSGRLIGKPAEHGPSTQVIDIALDDDRTLRGRFIDNSGRPIDGAIVAIRQSERVIASSTTLNDGTFQISGVPSGSFRLTCGSAAGQIRCWTSEAAPPHAVVDGVTFQDSVVRGQAIAVVPALLGGSAMTTAAASGMAIGGVATYAAVEGGANGASPAETSTDPPANPPPGSSSTVHAGQLVGRDAEGNLIRIRGTAPWQQGGPNGPPAPTNSSGIILPSNGFTVLDAPRWPASP